MSDLIKTTKKVFTVGVVVTTILWAMGAAMLVPGTANADSTCPTFKAGDMLKVTGDPAIWSVNNAGKLLYFPSGYEFKSWNVGEGYKGLYTSVSQTCFNAMEQATTNPTGITFRSGSYVIKRPSSDQLYVVLPDNTKQLATAAYLKALYGADYTAYEMSPVFWANYVTTKTGTLDVDSSGVAVPHEGMLVKVSDKTYYVGSTGLQEVDATGMTANRFKVAFVQTVESKHTASMSAGTAISAEVAAVSDRSQGGGVIVTPPATTTTTVAVGALAVSLASNSPAAGNVVSGIDNVVFGKFNLKNSSSADVIVNSVKIGRKGLGATVNFTSITLYDGATKLGSTKTSWSSDGTMSYNISGGKTIAANSTLEVTMVANLLTPSTYNALGIISVALAKGTVSGVPAYGNEMKGVAVTVGGVTITDAGTDSTKKIGTNDVTLAKFKLAINSTEDAKFYSITLRNRAATNNASDTDIKNVVLYKGATKLSGAVTMSSDKITFTLDTPYAIKKSKNETFTVKGDIVDGNANTIEFVLDATTDLEVVGDIYGTNLTVTSGAYNAATEGVIVTIAGSELNIAFTSTALETPNDRTDVLFGELTLSSGASDIKITELLLTVDELATAGSATANAVLDIDEFELVDKADGTSYSGVMTAAADSDSVSEVWTFSDEVYLTAGTSRTFTVQGDIPNSVTTSDAYRVTMTVNTTNLTAETVPAGDSVSSFSAGSFSGQWVTVKDAYLTVKATALNVGNAVVGDTDVMLYKGTLEATAGDVKMEVLDFDADTTLDVSNWTDLGLYTVDASNNYTLQQNITNSSMTTGTLTFDTLEFTVPEGSNNKVTFVVKGIVDSSVNSSNNIAHIKVDYITAKDSDNDTVTVYNTAGSTVTDANSNFETTTRIVTLYDKGILYVQMRNTDAGFGKDRVLLAGKSAWVGKLRLRAQYEDIRIKDLKFTNNSSNDEDSLASLCLYKAQSTATSNLIGCSTMDSSDLVFFDDIDYTVVQGTEDVYLYATSNEMSSGASGTSDSKDLFQFKIATTTGHLTAEGIASGEALTTGDYDSAAAAGEIVFDGDLDGTYDEDTADDGTANTKAFYVAGSKISSVAYVSSYSGEVVDTSLGSTGEFTMAILQIVTENHSNTDGNGNALLMGIQKFHFDLEKYAETTFGHATATFTIERIGGSQGAKAIFDLGGTNAASSTSATSANIELNTVTSTMTTDAYIGAGATAYFVIKGQVDAVSSTVGVTDWIRLNADDLKGTAGSTDSDNVIDWFDGYDTTYNGTNQFEYLLLDTTKLSGTKISD